MIDHTAFDDSVSSVAGSITSRSRASSSISGMSERNAGISIISVAKGHVPVLSLLLIKGAIVVVKTPGERTPLHISPAYPDTSSLLL